MRLAVDHHREEAVALTESLATRGVVPFALAGALLEFAEPDEGGIQAQRARVSDLKRWLHGRTDMESKRLLDLADYLVTKSVWIIGGDGWAYDIGYGGLDHVLSLGRNLNIVVLDTEVYSNTGGQQSKSTPMGASAKFAVSGKATAKKDLGMMAMAYRNVYVAKVAFGAKDAQTLKAFQEAEAYPGTSLIIAYSHCIAHGYDLAFGLDQQKAAVDSGHWPLFRFDPRRLDSGEAALMLDSGPPKISLDKYVRGESRYRMVEQAHPERFKALMAEAQENVTRRQVLYEELAGKKA